MSSSSEVWGKAPAVSDFWTFWAWKNAFKSQLQQLPKQSNMQGGARAVD